MCHSCVREMLNSSLWKAYDQLNIEAVLFVCVGCLCCLFASSVCVVRVCCLFVLSICLCCLFEFFVDTDGIVRTFRNSVNSMTVRTYTHTHTRTYTHTHTHTRTYASLILAKGTFNMLLQCTGTFSVYSSLLVVRTLKYVHYKYLYNNTVLHIIT